MGYKHIMDSVDAEAVAHETWEKVTEMTDKLLKDFEAAHPAKVKEFLREVEDVLLYPPYTEQEAKNIVSMFVNKDGTRGAHWPIEEVREVAKKKPELTKFDCYDFFITLNMMYSDYYNSKFTAEDYIEFAEDFLDDIDAPKSKLRRYIHAMKK